MALGRRQRSQGLPHRRLDCPLHATRGVRRTQSGGAEPFRTLYNALLFCENRFPGPAAGFRLPVQTAPRHPRAPSGLPCRTPIVPATRSPSAHTYLPCPAERIELRIDFRVRCPVVLKRSVRSCPTNVTSVYGSVDLVVQQTHPHSAPSLQKTFWDIRGHKHSNMQDRSAPAIRNLSMASAFNRFVRACSITVV